MFKDFNKYEIYEDGRIWSYKTKRFLKPKTTNRGYQVVQLSDNEGKIKTYSVHRIVYESVTGEPILENLQINHINECKTDNRFENLNLMTRKENINFGTGIERKTKTQSKQVGAYKDGKLVMLFSSTNEAGRNGFDQGNISYCCNGKRKTHKGYEWKYI